MASTNAEIIRTWCEGLYENPSDLGDLSFLDSEILYEDEILPDHVGETYVGHDGFRKAWERALEPWTDVQGRLDWVRENGDDVVSCHTGEMRGRESGVVMSITYGYIWRFRDGRVVYCKSFADPVTALREAGIDP